MSWFSKFLGSNEVIVGVTAETDEQSVQRGVEALDGYAAHNNLEETREKEFHCGICGWVPISQYHEHPTTH